MLPITLKPKQNYELIRLGSRYDGGYLLAYVVALIFAFEIFYLV